MVFIMDRRRRWVWVAIRRRLLSLLFDGEGICLRLPSYEFLSSFRRSETSIRGANIEMGYLIEGKPAVRRGYSWLRIENALRGGPRPRKNGVGGGRLPRDSRPRVPRFREGRFARGVDSETAWLQDAKWRCHFGPRLTPDSGFVALSLGTWDSPQVGFQMTLAATCIARPLDRRIIHRPFEGAEPGQLEAVLLS